LKSETAQARPKADVLGALDELSRRIRGDLGEASAMIAEQAKPPARVSTSSLEALQLFSLGRATPFTSDLPVERAGLSMLLGRSAEAIKTLDRAAESGFRNIVWIRTNSDLHPLHGDTRLDAIVAKMRPRR
jgi:hypothetical protein